MSDNLRRLAARASVDPWFLGYVLTAYQRRHDMDDAALARLLSAMIQPWLSLCACVAGRGRLSRNGRWNRT